MNKFKKIMDEYDKQYAFIDECGNYGFDFAKPGVSSHFIISAIIVTESQLYELEKAIENIRKFYFQTGEMKSSGIGNNYKRREKILSDIATLNFHHYSVVIDKKRIFTDSGLMYKKSFIKYLNSMLHKELKLAFPKLRLVSDTHGSKEFMSSFANYVESRNQPNLFEEYEFGFVNSKSNVLVQLADIVAGTLSFKYEEKRDSSLFPKFFSYIKEKCIGLVEWPICYENYIYEYERLNNNDFDKVIYANSMRLVINYLENNKKSDVFVD